MIRVNLLEKQPAKKKIAFDLGKQITAISLGIVAITLLGIGWRMHALAAEQKQVDDAVLAAQQETTRLHGIIEQVRQFEQRKAALQQRVTLIEQLRTQQVGPVRMLDQISLALPPTVWLLELKQPQATAATASSPAPSSNDVLIDGKAMALTGLSDFVANLERSGYFEHSVEIVSSTTETTGQDELVRFQVKATFKDPSAPPAPAVAAAPVKAKS